MGLLLLATAAFGQAVEVSSTADSVEQFTKDDWLAVRARYGAAIRDGKQTDQGPGLTYSGTTPNDLALAAWWWFALDGKLGTTLNAQREGFGLFDGQNRVTQGSLLRISAGPVGRFRFGPVRLEPQIAYSYNEVPVFGSSGSPVFSPARRHGVLLAARGMVDVGPVSIEARGEVPLSLAASDSVGAGTATGFVVGAAARIQLFQTGTMYWGLLIDGSYMSDSFTGSSGAVVASQNVIRVGGGLDLQLRETILRQRAGTVVVKVRNTETKAAVEGVEVQVGSGAEMKTASTDAEGIARFMEVKIGAKAIHLSKKGYDTAEAGTIVKDRDEVVAELLMTKALPTTGEVALTVVDAESAAAVVGAKISLGSMELTTDAKGIASAAEVAPGPVSVKVTAENYNPGDEAISIVAGKKTEVTIKLNQAKAKVLATISGNVRSTKGGGAIAAELEIPEAKIKTKANPQGAFSFRVPGGTYTVRISATGYLTQTKNVTVKDGDQAIFNVDLSPK